MNEIFNLFKNLGPTKLGVITLVLVALIGFFIYLTSRLVTPDFALLYTDLSVNDGAAIVGRLEGMGIPYEASPDGSRIRVPSDQVGKVRMTMAGEGIPAGGSVGYEIFNETDHFGVTNFVQNINHLRALEGELARTISTLKPIQSARVHLVLPKREIFSRQEQKATASVFLKLSPGVSLTKQQVMSIQHLVAAAVPLLQTKQISIIDDKGNLLARGMGDTEDGFDVMDAKEQKTAIEMRMTDAIEGLLSKTLGFGKVRAEVHADVNFDRVVKNIESYDPDGQVVRSTLSVEESNNAQNNEGSSASSVSSNVPGGAGAGGSNSSNEQGNRTEETVNYEISKTITNMVQQVGQIKKLSVAVLVDGLYQPDENGGQVYQPRPKEEIAQIETLVKSAIGFDADRGDVVEIINMKFVTESGAFDTAQNMGFLDFIKQDMVRVVELSILGVVSILVMLLVVRPIVMRLIEKTASGVSPMNTALSFVGPSGQQAISHDEDQLSLSGNQNSGALPNLSPRNEGTDEKIEQMIDLNQVEGKVRASSIKKVGEIVTKHPQDAVNIIRSWINDGR